MPQPGHRKPTAFAIAATLFLAALPAVLRAEQPAPATAEPALLTLELNAVVQEQAACRLIFVAENRLGADLVQAVFETVLFTADGQVERLTLFDFQALPQGRTRVRQFDLADTDCAGIGRVLINGAATCSGPGLDATACEAGLRLSSRAGVEVAG